MRRTWEAMPLAAIHSTGVDHSFAGRLFGYATLRLGDGPRGRDVRFVGDAERIAEAILANTSAGRTWSPVSAGPRYLTAPDANAPTEIGPWTQIEGPAVSEQPAPRSRLA
jgi:hypothetical protein